MAFNTNVTDHWDFNELLEYADDQYGIADDVRELLGKHYEADEDGEFGDDLGKDDPEFVIKVEGGDERCGYFSEDIFHVHLPNREAADELADILGGKVTEDGTVDEGSKTYVITYTRFITVKANSKKQALVKFEAMADDALNQRSDKGTVLDCNIQK